ncbi:MAG: ATPase [Gammaproteobacteria bacterium RIFCSPLOWO2_02_FULL_61_13]|nr:MAG: ATPase [Gammaproteobacteria bacterium RIFCSPLOWO2_02_FULL_61_13]
MYEAFYGLTGKPFQLNPDPSFYFGSGPHRRAMAYLEYGVHQNEGFIVITGEIGAGKTTLVRNLFRQLSSAEVVAANLVSTQLDADDMLRMVAVAFGIPSKHADKAALLASLEAFLVSVAKQGKRCLLVVDEAQNLTLRALEELRMLSNFQLETHALLQSFLIGQPEFRRILRSPQMQQLRQRVIAGCHIGPMDAEETRGYINHRLTCVGWKDTPQFQPDAYQAIFEASGGIPRRVNSICDRLLLSGFLADNRIFAREDVVEVAEDLNEETLAPRLIERGVAELDTAAKQQHLTVDDIDPMQLEIDDAAAKEAYQIVDNLSREDLAQRLVRLGRSVLRLERSVLRLETSNAASLAMFERLISRLRPRNTDKEDSG